MDIFTSQMPSPLGTISLIADSNSLLELNFDTTSNQIHNPNPILTETQKQLQAYFEGKLKVFDLGINPQGTVFEKDIWNRLCTIPYAGTTSYSEFSAHHPNAIRAIASANGKNKIPIIIPCHRVIGKNGKLVGYSGDLWRKRWLLDHEQETAQIGQTQLKF